MPVIRTLSFSAPIWKIASDELTGWLALEIRNADALQAEFAVVDPLSGQLIISEYRMPERWWVRLKSVQGGFLEIHQFQPTIKSAEEVIRWKVNIESLEREVMKTAAIV